MSSNTSNKDVGYSTRSFSESGFIAGTPVHTNKGLVAIDQLKAGDMVLSKPESGEGEQLYQRVVNIIKSVDKKKICSFQHITNVPSRFKSDNPEMETIYLTDSYPIWVHRLGEGAALNMSYELGYEVDPNKQLGWQPASDVEDMECILFDNIKTILCGTWGRHLYSTDIESVFWAKPTGYDAGLILDFRNDQQVIYFIGDRLDDCLSPEYMYSCGNYVIYGDPTLHPLVHDFLKMVRDTGLTHAFYGEAKLTVYNLEVEHYHTYYVGELGLWVHDAKAVLDE